MTKFRPETQRAYAGAWAAWVDWRARALRQHDLASLGDYALLDRYLVERWREGAAPSTLGAIYTRLRAGYAAEGRDWPDPERTLPDRWRLGLERMGLPRKRARPLTAARLAMVEASGTVRERVIALIRVMRDGLLNVQEVRTCCWADIDTDDRGSARLKVSRAGQDVWLSPATAQALVAMRPDGSSEDDPVFGTRRDGLLRVPRPETLTSWIREGAWTAGLGDGYSGSSPRHGMIADLPPDVGRDPLPANLNWAEGYANDEVVRWYMGTPPQSSNATEFDLVVIPVPGGRESAAQLREWLQGQGKSAASMWHRLGICASTAGAWQAGRTDPPPWMPLVLAADRRAEGATAEGATDLRQAMRDGGWSDYVLAAGLGVSRQTIQRWRHNGTPDLVLRYAIGELELRVPPAGRRGRGAAAKLSDPSYRAIDWPHDGSALGDEGDPGDAAAATEARAPHGVEPTSTETARAAGSAPRDEADPGDAADVAEAGTRVPDGDEPTTTETAREAAAAGLRAGHPRGLEIAADALARRAGALVAGLQSSPEDVDAYREVVALCREAARAGRGAATSTGLGIAARTTYISGMYLARSGGSDAEIEAAYRDATSLGRAAGEPRALEVAAEASHALAALLARTGRPQREVEAAYEEAVELGSDAKTARGWRTVARARAELAARLAEWGRPEGEVEAACRAAVETGRAAGEPRALEVAAEALLSVAESKASRGDLRRNVEPVYRDAAAAGRDAKTPKGLATAARALLALGDKFPYWWRWGKHDAEQEVLGNLPALEHEGVLLRTDARRIADARHPEWEQAVKKLENEDRMQREAAYREATELGSESGGADGLTAATVAIARLAGCLDDWGRPRADVEAAYREVAELGRKSGSADGLTTAAEAIARLASRLDQWRRPSEEVEAACREAAELGSESGTPEGRAVADEMRSTLHRRTSGWRGALRSIRNSTS